jgi:adhesin/invasin
MASRFPSFGWCLVLGTLVVGLAAGCGGGTNPPQPPNPPAKNLPDVTRSKVEVDRTADVAANGNESVTITVTVLTASGAPLAERTVQLEVSGQGNTVTPPSGRTDAEGVLRATLVSSVAGTKNITATVETEGAPVVLGTRPSVTFVAPRAEKLAFKTTLTQATAGALLSPVLEVELQDSTGSRAYGSTGVVTLALATGPAAGQLEGTLTANAVDGLARFTEVRIKVAGSGYSLRATSGTLAEALSPTFEVVPAAASRIELTGMPASVTAGASSALRVTLRDAFGNVATNYTGTVRFNSSDLSAGLPEDYTFTAADAGQALFGGLSFKSAGTQRLTVTDIANPALTASVDVQVGAGDALRLGFVQQPGNRSVRATLAPVQVALIDAFGNVVRENAPPVTVALSPDSGLGGTVTVSPVDGVASFSNLSIAEERNGYTLTATAQGLDSATSAAFDIIDDVFPARPVLTQGPTTVNSITVQWTAVGDDGDLGTATSQELRYATTDIVTEADFDAATLVATGAPQAAGSAESATLSGLSPSSNYYVALKVTDSAGNSTRSLTLPVSTPDPAITQMAFITQPVDTTAGAAMADVRVALRDADGNTVPTATQAVTLNLRNGPVFTPVTVNAVAGVATFSGITLTTAGTGYRFEASVAGLPPVQSDAFTIRPGPAASLDLVGLVAPVTAGVAGSVQVTARDAHDNVATGYTGTVRFTSTDGAATLPADYTFVAGDAGQKSFTGVVLRTAGTQTVTVTDTASATLTDSLTVDVDSGAATQLVLTVPATPVTAGSAFSVQVTLRDDSGNIATGYTGTVRFTSDDGAAVLPADYTFTPADAGQKTFSGVELRTAGSRSLTARDTGNAALTDTESLTVNAAALASLTLAAPGTATAGASFSVTVSARDAFGNLVPGYTGTVQFSSDDGQATLPADYTFTPGDAGSRMFSVTLRSVGSQPVRVTDGTRSASADVTVSPGAAARLELTGLPGTITAGASASVDVTAFDAFDNVATGYAGTVAFTSNDGAAVLPASYTFTATDAGSASFTVELRTAGSRSVTVTDTGNGALTSTASTTVNPAAPSQLAFSQQPANGTVRATLAEVRVALLDAYGNTTPATSPEVTVWLTGGNASATLSGTLDVAPASGVASFTDLSVDQEGIGFQLSANAPGVGDATSATFDIVDNIAPATAVISGVVSGADSITVSWTAVGDDGHLGTASSYELRYALTPITSEAEFAAATSVSGMPTPQAPGSSQSKLVTGLTLTADHYFALKVFDGAGNFSRSAGIRVSVADPCSGVTCTPPPDGCSADGTSVLTYASACVVSGGMPTCQDTSTAMHCGSFNTCSAGACVPVTPGSQEGSIIISEFSALGSEFIELHNPTGAAIDVAGFTFRNAAGETVDLRAPNDPNGTAGTPVVVAAGGFLYGIPNPSGAIPPGVGFVYGAPGTSFSLTDTGDALALYTAPPAGNLQDAVDFRSFVTDPDMPLTASNFVGFAGSSTQVDPGSLSAAGNDTATHWCVSFYPAGMRGARITNTAGAANGSCKVAVINEAYIDPPGADDQKAFIEIAGPGGSVIGGAKILDLEGRGASAGTLNTDDDMNPGDQDGVYTLPAGTRIPADGILLLADANAAGTTTQVPGFVAGVDLLVPDMDMENSTGAPPVGDAIQLVAADGTLLDVLGHEPNGALLDVATAYNGLPMYETGTARYILPSGAAAAVSLARSPSSTDTDDNFNDFRTDPTPTPGVANDEIVLTVTSLTPDDGPATSGVTGMSVVGTDFVVGMRIRVGALPDSPCTVSSATTATCTVIANPGGGVTRMNVSFTNPAASGGQSVVLPNAFTYTGNENETGSVLEADFCILQFPASFTVQRNQTTVSIYGKIYELGVTEADGSPPGIIAEVGYGNAGTDPRSNSTWRFFPAEYSAQVLNDDEFVGSFTAPNVNVSTNYSYTFRFSQDGGLRWTYCDKDGAGSNEGHDFSASELGTMTVTL